MSLKPRACFLAEKVKQKLSTYHSPCPPKSKKEARAYRTPSLQFHPHSVGSGPDVELGSHAWVAHGLRPPATGEPGSARRVPERSVRTQAGVEWREANRELIGGGKGVLNSCFSVPENCGANYSSTL